MFYLFPHGLLNTGHYYILFPLERAPEPDTGMGRGEGQPSQPWLTPVSTPKLGGL